MAPMLLATTRLLADHGQFFAYDASVDPYESFPVITEDTTRRGWARTDRAIYYFTVGQLWDFRLDLFRGTQPPRLDNADRVLGHTLHLSTGTLAVGNPVADGNVTTIELAPGPHSLFLRACHLGVEADADMETRHSSAGPISSATSSSSYLVRWRKKACSWVAKHCGRPTGRERWTSIVA